jgi:hypothetical protein
MPSGACEVDTDQGTATGSSSGAGSDGTLTGSSIGSMTMTFWIFPISMSIASFPESRERNGRMGLGQDTLDVQ